MFSHRPSRCRDPQSPKSAPNLTQPMSSPTGLELPLARCGKRLESFSPRPIVCNCDCTSSLVSILRILLLCCSSVSTEGAPCFLFVEGSAIKDLKYSGQADQGLLNGQHHLLLEYGIWHIARRIDLLESNWLKGYSAPPSWPRGQIKLTTLHTILNTPSPVSICRNSFPWHCKIRIRNFFIILRHRKLPIPATRFAVSWGVPDSRLLICFFVRAVVILSIAWLRQAATFSCSTGEHAMWGILSK